MTLKVFLVWCVVVVGLQMDMYSAIKIKVEPETFDKEKGTTVDVTCKVDDAESEAKDIVLMKIARKGERAIVLLHQNNSLTYVSGNAEEFPAKGYIYRDVADSNLQITITSPDPEDSGAYICSTQYTDDSGAVKERKAIGHLTVEAAEVKMLNNTIKKLLEKVEREKGEIKDIEKKEAEDKKKVVDLTDKSEKQSKDIEKLVEKEAEVENKVKDLEQKTKEQIKKVANDIDKNPSVKKLKDEVRKLANKVKTKEKDIGVLNQIKIEGKNKVEELSYTSLKQGEVVQNLQERLSDVETQLEDMIKKLHKKIDITLEHDGKEDLKEAFIDVKDKSMRQNDQIENIIKTVNKVDIRTQKLDNITTFLVEQMKKNEENVDSVDTSLVAFYVTSGVNNMYPQKGRSLIFQKVLLNEGRGYNARTGVFKAPRNGIYAFHLALQIPCLDCKIELTIVSNNGVLSRYVGGFKYNTDQHATSAVTLLGKGDTIKTVVKNVRSSQNIRWSLGFSQKSSFSGYLIVPT